MGKAEHFRNPAPTVDLLIFQQGLGVVLVRRANPPLGYALPGGFIDYGETAEHAAVREALEETGLQVELQGLLGVYSHPSRDPRSHTMSSVFVAIAHNPLAVQGGDDAAEAGFFDLGQLPALVFDHARIVKDFSDYLSGARPLAPLAYASPAVWEEQGVAPVQADK